MISNEIAMSSAKNLISQMDQLEDYDILFIVKIMENTIASRISVETQKELAKKSFEAVINNLLLQQNKVNNTKH